MHLFNIFLLYLYLYLYLSSISLFHLISFISYAFDNFLTYDEKITKKMELLKWSFSFIVMLSWLSAEPFT